MRKRTQLADESHHEEAVGQAEEEPADDDSLFKLAVNHELDLNKSKDQKVKMSTKYQVLSTDTSFVGIAKQKNKCESPV